MGGYSRSRCRDWALQFLYQAEFSGRGQPGAVERFWSHFQEKGGVPAYLKELVEGVESHLEELDAFIVRPPVNQLGTHFFKETALRRFGR